MAAPGGGPQPNFQGANDIRVWTYGHAQPMYYGQFAHYVQNQQSFGHGTAAPVDPNGQPQQPHQHPLRRSYPGSAPPGMQVPVVYPPPQPRKSQQVRSSSGSVTSNQGMRGGGGDPDSATGRYAMNGQRVAEWLLEFCREALQEHTKVSEFRMHRKVVYRHCLHYAQCRWPEKLVTEDTFPLGSFITVLTDVQKKARHHQIHLGIEWEYDKSFDHTTKRRDGWFVFRWTCNPAGVDTPGKMHEAGEQLMHCLMEPNSRERKRRSDMIEIERGMLIEEKDRLESSLRLIQTRMQALDRERLVSTPGESALAVDDGALMRPPPSSGKRPSPPVMVTAPSDASVNVEDFRHSAAFHNRSTTANITSSAATPGDCDRRDFQISTTANRDSGESGSRLQQSSRVRRASEIFSENWKNRQQGTAPQEVQRKPSPDAKPQHLSGEYIQHPGSLLTVSGNLGSAVSTRTSTSSLHSSSGGSSAIGPLGSAVSGVSSSSVGSSNGPRRARSPGRFSSTATAATSGAPVGVVSQASVYTPYASGPFGSLSTPSHLSFPSPSLHNAPALSSPPQRHSYPPPRFLSSVSLSLSAGGDSTGATAVGDPILDGAAGGNGDRPQSWNDASKVSSLIRRFESLTAEDEMVKGGQDGAVGDHLPQKNGSALGVKDTPDYAMVVPLPIGDQLLKQSSTQDDSVRAFNMWQPMTRRSLPTNISINNNSTSNNSSSNNSTSNNSTSNNSTSNSTSNNSTSNSTSNNSASNSTAVSESTNLSFSGGEREREREREREIGAAGPERTDATGNDVDTAEFPISPVGPALLGRETFGDFSYGSK